MATTFEYVWLIVKNGRVLDYWWSRGEALLRARTIGGHARHYLAECIDGYPVLPQRWQS